MADPDAPITDEQLAAIRQAFAQPQFDDVLTRLPPEIRTTVEAFRAALDDPDPKRAVADLVRERRGATPPASPEVLRVMIGSILADALQDSAPLGKLAELGEESLSLLQRATEPVDDEALDEKLGTEAGEAFRDVLEQLHSLDLEGVFGPVLADAAAFQQQLDQLPGQLSRLDRDPEAARQHIDALEQRARQLEQRALAADDEGRLEAIRAAVDDLSAALEAARARSPHLSLIAAATQAREGEHEQARATLREALDLAEAQGAYQVAEAAAVPLQLERVREGDLEGAIGIGRRMQRLADRCGSPRKQILTRYDLGLLLARSGRRDEGQALAVDALGRATDAGVLELIARGMLVIAKIVEGSGNTRQALEHYQKILKHRDVEGLEQEIAQAAMGVLRCLGPEAVTDPRRFAALELARRHARQSGDAETFAQLAILLAESREATGDRLGALHALYEGRAALASSPTGDPTVMDPAVQAFREAWGDDRFEALKNRLDQP